MLSGNYEECLFFTKRYTNLIVSQYVDHSYGAQAIVPRWGPYFYFIDVFLIFLEESTAFLKSVVGFISGPDQSCICNMYSGQGGKPYDKKFKNRKEFEGVTGEKEKRIKGMKKRGRWKKKGNRSKKEGTYPYYPFFV